MDRRAEINAEIRARIKRENRLRATRGASGPYLLVAVLLVVGAFTGGRLSVDPSPVYQEFTVETREIKAREPRVEVRWRDRIVYREVEPEFTATAPGGGRVRVVEFCHDSSGLAVPDSAVSGPQIPEKNGPPSRLVASGRVRRGWLPFSADRVNIFSLGSDGSLAESEFRVRGGYEFVASNRVELRASRWWWAKEAARVALPATFGYGFCKLTP